MRSAELVCIFFFIFFLVVALVIIVVAAVDDNGDDDDVSGGGDSSAAARRGEGLLENMGKIGSDRIGSMERTKADDGEQQITRQMRKIRDIGIANG
jgi:hypothetical protein